MAINGIARLNVLKVQKEYPKGKAITSSLASEQKELEGKIKSKYPYLPKVEKMSYGSLGKVFNI